MKALPFTAVLVALFASAAHSKPPPKPNATQIYRDALDFAEREMDVSSLEKIQLKSLTQRPSDWPIIQQVFDYQIRTRNRLRLQAMMRVLVESNRCQDRPPAKVCTELEKRWTGHLADLLFYEESAPKIERARRLLEAKDCAGAATVLKEVESREGLVMSVEQGLRKALVCMGDARGLDELEQRAMQVKVF